MLPPFAAAITCGVNPSACVCHSLVFLAHTHSPPPGLAGSSALGELLKPQQNVQQGRPVSPLSQSQLVPVDALSWEAVLGIVGEILLSPL